ncbi:MAG: diguanylate cyclase [Vicinamibacterales bacterium]
MARRFASAVGAGDLLARPGGDEFAVLVHNPQSPTAAEQVARRLIESLAQPVRVADLSLTVGTCVGIVSSRGRERDTHELMRLAAGGALCRQGTGP